MPALSREDFLKRYARYFNPRRVEAIQELGFFFVEGAAEGVWFHDSEGHRFLDLWCMGGLYNLGHRHPVLMDVARKALILGRLLGFTGELDDIALESLVPESARRLSLRDFLARLEEYDADWDRRAKDARDAGRVLRYVASVTRRRVEVGLQAVDASSPFASLNGTDNQVAFTTMRYQTNPLIITCTGDCIIEGRFALRGRNGIGDDTFNAATTPTAGGSAPCGAGRGGNGHPVSVKAGAPSLIYMETPKFGENGYGPGNADPVGGGGGQCGCTLPHSNFSSVNNCNNFTDDGDGSRACRLSPAARGLDRAQSRRHPADGGCCHRDCLARAAPSP